jgi:hypothetical protein
MSEGSKPELFETLPEQGPTERPRAAPRLRQAERRQVSLRPVSLEDLGVVQIRVTPKTRNPFTIKALSISGVT